MDTLSPSPPAHSGGSSKRRQYAAGQTQAYYGAADGGFGGQGFEPNYGGGATQQAPQQPGGQLFTPGLTGQQFGAQQQQLGTQQQQLGTQQQQLGTQQQQPYYQPGEGEYGGGQPQGPVYGQQPQAGPGPQVAALADQFGQMGMGGAKPFQLYTTNLLTSPPEPQELLRPPPEVRLPPNACLSPSPDANADSSYLRCTLNAIPTTNSLLQKSKLPLGLIITPYRTLNEGESAVPVVTDTVIARCRRCRTYMNPFVQFIDGGNRYVLKLH